MDDPAAAMPNEIIAVVPIEGNRSTELAYSGRHGSWGTESRYEWASTVEGDGGLGALCGVQTALAACGSSNEKGFRFQDGGMVIKFRPSPSDEVDAVGASLSRANEDAPTYGSVSSQYSVSCTINRSTRMVVLFITWKKALKGNGYAALKSGRGGNQIDWAGAT